MILELRFQKSPLRCLKTAVCGVQSQEQTQEIKLSDAMPDIGRVIGCWGQVILRGKEWREGDVALTGGVMVWALYAPEDGTTPRTVEGWIPFQMKWDLPDETREGTISAQVRLRSLDGRSVSPRKLMLRASVSAWVEALSPAEETLYTPMECPGDVALLQNTYPVMIPTQTGEKTFQLDEELTLPASAPAPEKLVYGTFLPRLTEGKVTEGRAVLRGEGTLHVLYLTGESGVQSRDFSVPFSQLGELEDAPTGEAEVDAALALTDLDLGLDSDGHFRLKCGLTAQYVVWERLLLPLTEDAYSPRRTVEVCRESLDIPARLDQGVERIGAEQSLPIEAETVVDMAFYPDFPRQRNVEGGVEVELWGQLQLLYTSPEGLLQSAGARWEGMHRLEAGENCRIVAHTRQEESGTVTAAEGTMEAKHGILLEYRTVAQGGMPMVTGLELGELQEPDPARPSVILRRAGKPGLWELAKACGSRVEAIRQANALEGEPEEGRLLLIPVL